MPFRCACELRARGWPTTWPFFASPQKEHAFHPWTASLVWIIAIAICVPHLWSYHLLAFSFLSTPTLSTEFTSISYLPFSHDPPVFSSGFSAAFPNIPLIIGLPKVYNLNSQLFYWQILRIVSMILFHSHNYVQVVCVTIKTFLSVLLFPPRASFLICYASPQSFCWNLE